MSTSTDALFLYGIPLEEGSIEEYEEVDEGEPERSSALSRAIYMGNEVDGLKLVVHCSDKCPMHLVAIPDSIWRAHRGSPEQVDVAALPQAGGPEVAGRISTLRSFVEKHSLKTDGEPGWYLASYWG